MTRRVAAFLAAVLCVAAFAGAAQAAGTGARCITKVAAGDARFSTLVSLVKQAGLSETLCGKGPFTVFAPTNDAFDKLKKQAPDTFAAVASDKELLTKVLTYHVLAKRIASGAAVAAAKENAKVKTVQGERIALSLKNGKLTLNGNSRVVIADVKASNGIIHAINTVLVPPSISA
jgi:uncharacterized surface protein with fasciclin (FAS1) repeats